MQGRMDLALPIRTVLISLSFDYNHLSNCPVVADKALMALPGTSAFIIHETLYVSMMIHISTRNPFTLDLSSPNHDLHKVSPLTEDSSLVIISNISATRIKLYKIT